MPLANEMTKAYRAYLSEVEHEGRQSLTFIACGVGLVALCHPLLFLLAVPSTLLSWLMLYRRARLQFIGTLYRSEVLLRALRFDDYDPELLRTMELGRMEGAPAMRTSRLEGFWRSFDASCRSFGQHAVNGTEWLWWLALPLIVITAGMLLAPGWRHDWNWLPLPEPARGAFLDAAVFIVAWLVGIGAATLGKMVIQMALVAAAWDAVINMAEEPAPEEAADGKSMRESLIRWHLPSEGDAAPNGVPQP
jgi:hypothetical protein